MLCWSSDEFVANADVLGDDGQVGENGAVGEVAIVADEFAAVVAVDAIDDDVVVDDAAAAADHNQ